MSKKNTQPAVSVCLPVWNGASYLSAAIESVLGQTFTDFELVIADDGSTDTSGEIIAAFAARDSRIVVLADGGRVGLFENYNRCLRASKAPVLKLFAQDDLLHRQHLEKVMAVFFRQPDVALVSTAKFVIDEDALAVVAHEDILTPLQFLLPDWEAAATSGQSFTADGGLVPGARVNKLILESFQNFIGEPSTVSIRSEAVGSYFDSNFYHIGDLEYWLRILTSGPYYFLNEKLTSFRAHDKSATRTNNSNLLFATDLMRMLHKHRCLSEELGIDFVQQQNNLISSLAAHLYIMEASGTVNLEALRCGISLEGVHNYHEALESEYLLLRELLGKTLVQLGARENKFSQQQKDVVEMLARQKVVERQELAVRSLLASRSWKLTKVLRDLRARTFGVRAEGLAFETFDVALAESLTGLAQRQKEYLDYLTKLEYAILSSRSWRLTAVLRVLGLS